MTKYDYQTVGANNEPCDGWCVVKYADNCHRQKIAEGLTRSEAATMAASFDLLTSLKECQELLALVARPAKGTENMPSLLSRALVAEANARAAIEKAEPK